MRGTLPEAPAPPGGGSVLRETLGTSEHWDHQYNYGLRRIELSEESISNWQLQVNACHARMKDGSLVQLDAGQELDRIDLKAAFDRSDTVRAYLAVPRLKLGQRNVSRGEDGEPVRYLEATAILPDESEGGNDQEVQLRRLNVRLLLSTEDLSGYELLPIAEIQRSGENESVPRLSSKYIPPLLAIDAWAGLGRDIVRAIYDLLGKKAEVLSQQVINRGISLVSQEPGDLDRLLMLLQLNTAIAALEVLAFAQGVHPLVAYVELCRIVGQLSIFGPSRRLPEIPHYDHDDLGRYSSAGSASRSRFCWVWCGTMNLSSGTSSANRGGCASLSIRNGWAPTGSGSWAFRPAC